MPVGLFGFVLIRVDSGRLRKIAVCFVQIPLLFNNSRGVVVVSCYSVVEFEQIAIVR